MIFSTRAEYGVRFLVALSTAEGDMPVPLNVIAEREGLPLAYLERIVAKLKRHGVVESTRGAHGGYRLARRPEEIAMDEVVLALEGQIAPMECFTTDDLRRVHCSHQTDGGRACATKLLWMRVQGGVTRALAGTTLAELAEFAAAHEYDDQHDQPVAAA